MATGELCNAKRAGDVGKMAAQERFEPDQVEFFPRPYGGWMVLKVSHVRLVSFSGLSHQIVVTNASDT
jgi:hypothetical protein